MKANKMRREDVAAFVESEAGRDFLREQDAVWDEVMEIARAEGYVVQAGGGAAVLSTYGAALEAAGTDAVVRMLQMSGVEMPEEANNA